jgi:hypothetical protein
MAYILPQVVPELPTFCYTLPTFFTSRRQRVDAIGPPGASAPPGTKCRSSVHQHRNTVSRPILSLLLSLDQQLSRLTLGTQFLAFLNIFIVQTKKKNWKNHSEWFYHYFIYLNFPSSTATKSKYIDSQCSTVHIVFSFFFSSVKMCQCHHRFRRLPVILLVVSPLLFMSMCVTSLGEFRALFCGENVSSLYPYIVFYCKKRSSVEHTLDYRCPDEKKS